MDGVLNIDKPLGLTSHDVVARVRKAFDQRRVGHAGTLDPLATGVLLVCLGRATRIAEYLTAGRKRYRATIRLGVATETYDAEGEVVAERPVDVDESGIVGALASFRGTIEQVPPVYSAIKQDGQPLHRRARRGEVVTPRARQVEIDEVELDAWQCPDAIVRVTCSPGTYIRSLAHDLGAALSCGGHLAALVRTGSGSFEVHRAIPLDEIEAASTPEALAALVLPMDEALAHLPAVGITAIEAANIRQGQRLRRPFPDLDPALPCRARDPDGKLVAILTYDASRSSWRPRKVLDPAEN